MISTEHDAAIQTPWWKRNRFWLTAALVMAAVSLGYSWHSASEGFALLNRVTPIKVAAGHTGMYEGATWRVLYARLIDVPNARLRLHPQAALLVVYFEATPASTTKLDRLDQCRGRVSDDQRRHWDAYGRLPSGILHVTTDGCGGRGTVTSGPVSFQHAYAVPRGVPLTDFHPEIYFLVADKSAAGSYLRFEL